jgi:hypothetical protein
MAPADPEGPGVTLGGSCARRAVKWTHRQDRDDGTIHERIRCLAHLSANVFRKIWKHFVSDAHDQIDAEFRRWVTAPYK